MNVKKQFSEGLVTQNPALVQLLGMCPLLAITTSLFNGLGMGVMVIAVLTCSNVVISALRKIIPSKVRIACYIVVIAGFVTMVDLLIKGFVPALSSSLGLFIPLIVVNCIILGRATRTAWLPLSLTASSRASVTLWLWSSCVSSVSSWVLVPSVPAC